MYQLHFPQLWVLVTMSHMVNICMSSRPSIIKSLERRRMRTNVSRIDGVLFSDQSFASVPVVRPYCDVMDNWRKCMCNNATISRHVAWEELVAHEPRLNDLLTEALALRRSAAAQVCKNDFWYPGREFPAFKTRVAQLVGWDSGHPADSLLASENAWDVAQDTILKALPDCHGCSCCRLQLP